MITFKNIGLEACRLANQMSQYAAVLGVAYKNNYKFAIPYENQHKVGGQMFNPDPNVNKWIKVNFRVPEGFKITAPTLTLNDEVLITNEYKEDLLKGFDANVFNVKENTNIQGYFQCEKYWLHIKDIIKKEFTFKDNFYNTAKTKIDAIRAKFPELVAIHIRRGDYVGNQNRHPLQSIEYYQKGINLFNDKEYAFLIFSDDQKWCKEYFGESEQIFYIEDNIDFVDMCMMSLCNHNIIANSTFSWWAAWLNSNPDKKVIAPSTWLGPEIRYLQTEHIYCENWIVI
jgi:hypothetical protein